MDKSSRPNSSHTSQQRHSWRLQTHLRKVAHSERCRALPAMRPGEAEQLTAAFIAARGVTQCPPAYVAAVQ